MSKKLLIHACCAPCLVSVYDNICSNLSENGLKSVEEIDVLWYNINIQPKREYERRKDSLISYTNKINTKLIIEDEYDLVGFTCVASSPKTYEFESRCDFCYKKRLEFVFKYASDYGYQMVTTTLLTSPYQKHDKIIKICKDFEKKYNVKFLYNDFRIGFREGQKKAKDLGLYRQKYCGCVFSIDEGSDKYEDF